MAIDLRLDFGNTEAVAKRTSSSLRDYVANAQKVSVATGKASTANSVLAANVAKVKDRQDALNKATQRVEVTTKGLTTQTQKNTQANKESNRQFQILGKTVGSVSSRFGGLSSVVAGFTVGAVVNKAVREFASFDKGLIGVSKTTNITGNDLDRLGEEIESLSREIPVARTELLDIAQAAGQLGVSGSKNILRFTRTVAQLGTASNLAGEEAATTLARMLNVAGEAVDQVDELGSVIVALGNNMAATESEIARVALQVGQATTVFGVSSAEAAAFGAAMRSVGIQAELGGSSVGRAFRAINSAILGGGDALDDLVEKTGLTGEQLRKTFEEDSVRVFRLYVNGLGRAIKETGNAEAELEKLGLRGEEINKVLPTLAKNSSVLERALNLASKEVENSTALTREAIAASGSFSAQLTLIGNRVDSVASTIGEELAPAILDVTDNLADLLEGDRGSLRVFAEDFADLSKTVGGFIVSIGKGYSALPQPVKEGGAILAVLLGPKGLAALAGISFLANRIQNIAKAVQLIREGELGLIDFATFDGSELEQFLDDYEDDSESTERRINKKIASLRSKARNAIYADEQNALLLQAQRLEELLEREELSAALSRREAQEKELDDRLALEKAAREKAIAAEKAAQDKADADAIKAKQELSKQELTLRAQVLRQLATLDDKAAVQSIKANADVLRKKANGNKEIIALINKLQVQQILSIGKKERAELEKSLKNRREKEIAVDKRIAKEREIIRGGFSKFLIDRARKDLRDQQANANNTVEVWDEAYERILSAVDSIHSDIESGFSDLFGKTLRGEIDSFGEFFQGIMSSVSDAFVNAIARMAAEYAASQLFRAGGALLGGSLNFLGTRHTGDLRTDEGLAILQQGEIVVPAAQSEVIRQALSGQGVSQDDFFNRVAGSVSSVYGGVTDRAGSIASRAGGLNVANFEQAQLRASFAGNARAASLAGLASGASAYQQVQSIGSRLGAPQDVVRSAARSQAVNSFMSTFAGGFAGGVIGDALSTAVGVRDPGLFNSVNIAGFDVDVDDITSSLGTIGLSLAIGGIPGPIAAAVVTPMVRMGMSAVGDALGIRSNETLRDKVESEFGEINGRRAYASFQDRLARVGDDFFALTGGLSGLEVGQIDLLTSDDIVGLLKDTVTSPSRQQEVSSFRRAVTLGGFEFTSGIRDNGSATERSNLARDVIDRPGFYGFDTRSFAAETLGTAFPYDGNVYTADGRRVSFNEYSGSLSFDGGGTSGGDGGGSFGFGRDDQGLSDIGGSFGSMAGSTASGSDRSNGDGGGASEPGGFDGFGFQQGGVVDRLVVPRGDDGVAGLGFGEYVVRREAVQSIGVDALDTINQGGGIGGQVVVQIITQTGQQLQEFVVDTVRDASERNVAVVNANGVYGAA